MLKNKAGRSDAALQKRHALSQYLQRAIEETIAKVSRKGLCSPPKDSGKAALAWLISAILTRYFSKKSFLNFTFVVDRLDLADQAFKNLRRGPKVKRINNPQGSIKNKTDQRCGQYQKFKDDSDLTDRSRL